jgi:hypothetical protein
MTTRTAWSGLGYARYLGLATSFAVGWFAIDWGVANHGVANHGVATHGVATHGEQRRFGGAFRVAP